MKNHWLDKKKVLDLWELIFQFDGDDPVVFGTIKNKQSASFSFTAGIPSSIGLIDPSTGKRFTLSMRPKP
jgi:hypothetical protein